MKNRMKYGIGVILVITFMMAMVSITAADIYHEKEIIFNDMSIFTDGEKEHIKASLNSEHPEHETYGLKCILFGHTYKTEYVTSITHKVYATSPRCLREIYETNICEDCSDTKSELIGAELIICCE